MQRGISSQFSAVKPLFLIFIDSTNDAGAMVLAHPEQQCHLLFGVKSLKEQALTIARKECVVWPSHNT